MDIKQPSIYDNSVNDEKIIDSLPDNTFVYRNTHEGYAPHCAVKKIYVVQQGQIVSLKIIFDVQRGSMGEPGALSFDEGIKGYLINEHPVPQDYAFKLTMDYPDSILYITLDPLLKYDDYTAFFHELPGKQPAPVLYIPRFYGPYRFAGYLELIGSDYDGVLWIDPEWFPDMDISYWVKIDDRLRAYDKGWVKIDDKLREIVRIYIVIDGKLL